MTVITFISTKKLRLSEKIIRLIRSNYHVNTLPRT